MGGKEEALDMEKGKCRQYISSGAHAVVFFVYTVCLWVGLQGVCFVLLSLVL